MYSCSWGPWFLQKGWWKRVGAGVPGSFRKGWEWGPWFLQKGGGCGGPWLLQKGEGCWGPWFLQKGWWKMVLGSLVPSKGVVEKGASVPGSFRRGGRGRDAGVPGSFRKR